MTTGKQSNSVPVNKVIRGLFLVRWAKEITNQGVPAFIHHFPYYDVKKPPSPRFTNTTAFLLKHILPQFHASWRKKARLRTA